LITPESEEGRTLLRWIDAEDPAVAFTTHRPPEARLRALPKVEHIPSYHTIEPTLKGLPPFEVDSRAPDSQPPGPYRLCANKRSAAGPIQTFVSFSSELNGLGAATLPRSSSMLQLQKTPEAIRFRVAVSRLGEIRSCFPMNSSGIQRWTNKRACISCVAFPQKRSRRRYARCAFDLGIATIEWGTTLGVHTQRSEAALRRDSS